jgi:predicted HAD superfamily hydrolase
MFLNNLNFTSESVAEKSIPNLVELKQKILIADAISFDFFDTLYIRPLLHPEDVFDIIGRRFGIHNFRALRRAAQAEAFRRMHQAGRKEITLDGIYTCFDKGSVPSEELMKAEYDLELFLVKPNTELVDIFKIVIDSGKSVVMTSDMYLPAKFFEEALKRHNLPPVPIFVSADRNATKRDYGELFLIMAEELGLPPDRILHIGDNGDSDIKQAEAKGFATFHYKEYHCPPRQISQPTLESSFALGLIRNYRKEIAKDSSSEIGFLYGGPAAIGFLDWIKEQAQKDRIDHILFLARDGYVLNNIAKSINGSELPQFSYFLGSRVAFTLAAINSSNFLKFLPFLLSGSQGLSTSDLLERIGVNPPADEVMEDLGLGRDSVIEDVDILRLQSFLYSYRWEILKICRRNRRALFVYLKQLGIKPGMRVALVDVGWNGTTQDAFELAIENIIDLHVFGYYFCLADTPDCRKRRETRRMQALFSSQSTSEDLIQRIYDNRIGVELFFSAPHESVIGLDINANGVVGIADPRKDGVQDLLQLSAEITKGIEMFSHGFQTARSEIRLPTSPINIAMPLIDYVVQKRWSDYAALKSFRNFDGWARTSNVNVRLLNT